MKVCLSWNVDYKYLQNADEIKFQWKDREGIEKFQEEYPESQIILSHKVLQDEEIDFKWLKDTEILMRRKLILALDNLEEAKKAQEEDIMYYLDYPITSYYELSGIMETLNPIYIVLGAPLFFDMENVKRLHRNIKIRAIPNVAYEGFPHKNGIVGTWIRPEDLEEYENFVDSIEFKYCNKFREEALYRIYITEKEWSGDLKDIILFLDAKGDNAYIDSENSRMRIKCGQRCQDGRKCHICYNMLDMADEKLLTDYLDAIGYTREEKEKIEEMNLKQLEEKKKKDSRIEEIMANIRAFKDSEENNS